MFTIHSVNSEKELIFSSYENEYFRVELKGTDVYAYTEVWDAAWVDVTFKGLDRFLDQLAKNGQPWHGEQKWTSLDHEFSLCVSCSKTGQVTFQVELDPHPGNGESWFVKANIMTELGHLEKIAKDAELFFTKKSK